MVGTLPGTYLTAQFGSALGQGKTIMTAISLCGLAASLALGVFLGRRLMTEIKADEAPTPPKPTPESITERLARLRQAQSLG